MDIKTLRILALVHRIGERFMKRESSWDVTFEADCTMDRIEIKKWNDAHCDVEEREVYLTNEHLARVYATLYPATYYDPGLLKAKARLEAIVGER